MIWETLGVGAQGLTGRQSSRPGGVSHKHVPTELHWSGLRAGPLVGWCVGERPVNRGSHSCS